VMLCLGGFYHSCLYLANRCGISFSTDGGVFGYILHTNLGLHIYIRVYIHSHIHTDISYAFRGYKFIQSDSRTAVSHSNT